MVTRKISGEQRLLDIRQIKHILLENSFTMKYANKIHTFKKTHKNLHNTGIASHYSYTMYIKNLKHKPS